MSEGSRDWAKITSPHSVTVDTAAASHRQKIGVIGTGTQGVLDGPSPVVGGLRLDGVDSGM